MLLLLDAEMARVQAVVAAMLWYDRILTWMLAVIVSILLSFHSLFQDMETTAAAATAPGAPTLQEDITPEVSLGCDWS